MPKGYKLKKVLLWVEDRRPNGLALERFSPALAYWALSIFPVSRLEAPGLSSTSPSHWTSASRTVPIKRVGNSLGAIYRVPHGPASEHLIPGLGRDKLTFAHSDMFNGSPYVYAQGSWLAGFQFKLLTGSNTFWPDITSSPRA